MSQTLIDQKSTLINQPLPPIKVEEVVENSDRSKQNPIDKNSGIRAKNDGNLHKNSITKPRYIVELVWLDNSLLAP